MLSPDSFNRRLSTNTPSTAPSATNRSAESAPGGAAEKTANTAPVIASRASIIKTSRQPSSRRPVLRHRRYRCCTISTLRIAKNTNSAHQTR